MTSSFKADTCGNTLTISTVIKDPNELLVLLGPYHTKITTTMSQGCLGSLPQPSLSQGSHQVVKTLDLKLFPSCNKHATRL